MRVRAELRTGLLRDLRRCCSPVDVEDFFRQLDRVCDDQNKVIERTDRYFDPEFSRYSFRWFAFGKGIEKIAVCHFTGKTVRVLKWQFSNPRRMRDEKDDPESGQ